MNEVNKPVIVNGVETRAQRHTQAAEAAHNRSNHLGKKALALVIAGGFASVALAPKAVDVGRGVVTALSQSESDFEKQYRVSPAEAPQPVPSAEERAVGIRTAEEYLKTERQAAAAMDAQRQQQLPDDPKTHVR